MTSTLPEAESRAKRGARALQLQGALFGATVPFVVFGLASLLMKLELPAVAAVALAFLVLLLALTAFVKYLYLSREPERLPISPDQILASGHAGLDVDGFGELRRELMLLAFEPLGGCRVLDESGALDHRIIDVWAHPQHQCYATIDQTLPFTGPTRHATLTYWTGMGDRWWYCSTTASTGRMKFLLRSGRFAWTSIAATGVENLLTAHLERREDAFQATGRKPDLPLSLDSFLNGESIRYSAQRDALRAKNVFVAVFEVLFFESIPHQEWMGDFARLM